MEKFYYDTITFIGGLSPFVKILIIGTLFIFDVLVVMEIVKTHVNPKKAVLKIGQFILLAILVAITIFISVHSI